MSNSISCADRAPSHVSCLRAEDPLHSDPHAALGSHHEWMQAAARQGVALALLDTIGAYIIGTGTNHSERESPVAWWRRKITDEVRRRGQPLTASLTRRFGLGDDVLSVTAEGHLTKRNLDPNG